MKTVYLNEDNTVREIIPEYALPPEKWYSEAFARRCVEDITLDMLADHEERLCMLELTAN